MTRWLAFLVALLLNATTSFHVSASEKSRPFFAFQNGVRFSSAEERINVLKELGYDGIGSTNPQDLENRLKLYDAAGLKIFSLYLGGRLNPEGTEVSPDIKEAIQQLNGRETVIELYVQGSSSNTDEQAVAYVRAVADLAQDSGLKVVLYPHAGFYVDTLSDAVRIATLCDRENVGVMFNLCHFLKVQPEADLHHELENAKPYLWQVSTSGADLGGENWGQLIQTLDRGTFDQAILFSALDSIGYRGPVGLQCYAIKGDPRQNLERSIQAWRQLRGGT
tara:strand:+ start:304 stop:1137 length:834 start_codon:yes stop_codon:yes gene_type:complete